MNPVRSQFSLIAIGLAGALALAACGKKEEPAPTPAPTPAPVAPAPVAAPPAAEAVSVTSVDLGKAVGLDQKITEPTTTFATKDTIYAAVSTAGAAPSATLSAKWTYQDGQTVNDSSQTIAPNGPAVTTFHISKPDGWPAGTYKVEVSIDGKPAMSKDFSVQ
jgi:hypothetical protein